MKEEQEASESNEAVVGRACSGGCCGCRDMRTPEERRAQEAARATRVMRFFIWGIILAIIVVLALTQS